jgi:di/tripeptidase
MEFLIKNPDIKHGKIRVGFTPDEEMDVAHFDVRNLELTGRIPWMEVSGELECGWKIIF